MAYILVVDDEKSIRKTFEIFLTKENHEVRSAESVEKAMEKIKEEEPELVITDIIMPKVSGIEFIEMIKDINEDIPVIIMTGEPTVETAKKSVKANAFDYLDKPINREQLMHTIQNALRHKKLLDNKKLLEEENKKYREHLETLVASRTKALNQAMQGTISTIASIVELRDPYTGGHQRKVANLAVSIGKKLGLSQDQIEGLYVTGYLHDIGKISIPFEFLSKPGKLTDKEFDVIKTHCEYGYELMKKITMPWDIAGAIYQHHERIDGSGYPRGLKGKEISLEAKIIAVSDVIEAMTSHRPYRPGLGIEVALDEIRGNKGIKYDEKVSDTVIELFEKDDYIFSEETHLEFSIK